MKLDKDFVPTSSACNLVFAQDISKSFGTLLALDHVSLSVKQGEVFGILGPNGAGKTTLMEILEGLQRPDTGLVSIMDIDVSRDTRSTRQAIGVVAHDNWLPPLSRVREIVEVYTLLYDDAWSLDYLLGRLGLREKRNASIATLSAGQRQRLAVGLALIGQPKLLFLDEPTSSLDPQARRFVWDTIRQVQKESGGTSLLTTHSMEEAESLCDCVMILDMGRAIDVGAPQTLIQRHCPGYHVRIACDSCSFPLLKDKWGASVVWDNRGFAVLFADDLQTAISELEGLVSKQSISARIDRVDQSCLEDVFLKLTGREFRDT